MACELVGELLDAFALGALDEPEMTAVRQHLAGCPACRAVLAEAETVVASLAVAVPLRRAPESLSARVLAQIALNDEAAASPSEAWQEAAEAAPLRLSSRRRIWRPGRLWGVGAAAAAVVLLAGAGSWITALQMQVNTLKDKSTVLEQGMSDVQGQRSALQLLASIGSSSLPMWPADSTDAEGTVIWNPMREQCSVLASDLPPAPSGETYHVWLLGDGPQRGTWDEGLLTPASSGSAQKTIDLHDIPMSQGYEVVIMLQPRQSSSGERHPVLRATVQQQ